MIDNLIFFQKLKYLNENTLAYSCTLNVTLNIQYFLYSIFFIFNIFYIQYFLLDFISIFNIFEVSHPGHLVILGILHPTPRSHTRACLTCFFRVQWTASNWSVLTISATKISSPPTKVTRGLGWV